MAKRMPWGRNTGYYYQGPDSMDRAFAQVSALADVIERNRKNQAAMALEGIKAKQALFPNATVSDQGELSDLAAKLKDAFGIDVVPKQTEQGYQQSMADLMGDKKYIAPATPGLTGEGGQPIRATSMSDALAAERAAGEAGSQLAQPGQFMPIAPAMTDIYSATGKKVGRVPKGAHVLSQMPDRGKMLLDASGNPKLDAQGNPIVVSGGFFQTRQSQPTFLFDESGNPVRDTQGQPVNVPGKVSYRPKPQGDYWDTPGSSQPQFFPKGINPPAGSKKHGGQKYTGELGNVMTYMDQMGIEKTEENVQMVRDSLAKSPTKDYDVEAHRKARIDAVKLATADQLNFGDKSPEEKIAIVENLTQQILSREPQRKKAGPKVINPVPTGANRPSWLDSNLPPSKR